MTSDGWIETSNILSKMVVEEIELSEWFFYREEGEDLETVGRQDVLQAHRDEAGGGGLNDGGAVAAAKILFIVLSEKSDFWVEEFPNKVKSQSWSHPWSIWKWKCIFSWRKYIWRIDVGDGCDNNKADGDFVLTERVFNMNALILAPRKSRR